MLYFSILSDVQQNMTDILDVCLNTDNMFPAPPGPLWPQFNTSSPDLRTEAEVCQVCGQYCEKVD